MTAVATAAIGSAVVAGGASYLSARQQSASSGDSIDFQKEQWKKARQDFKPFLKLGKWATGPLKELLRSDTASSALREDPGYKFRLGEGEKAISRGAAARGGQLGGAQQKALLRFGQDYASNERQRSIDNLLRTAGLGAGVSTQSGQIAQQVGRNVGNTYLQQGNARASGYINASNAVTGGARDWMYYNALREREYRGD